MLEYRRLREGERGRERQTDRQTETERERRGEREGERETERPRERIFFFSSDYQTKRKRTDVVAT